MSRRNCIWTFFIVWLLTVSSNLTSQTRHTCSTFLLKTNDSLFVGHNLDEYFDISGIVVINKRGIEKESLSWRDFRKGKKVGIPRTKWISKYGSVTYNNIGKDLIDGGMNEAGLYIGEMTLYGTRYPSKSNLPSIYHNYWMQYILDNYRSVPEVLESIDKMNVDGTCTWHFFVADRDGNAAAIEFIDGSTVIHTGKEMPYPILCNTTYSSDLDSVALYKEYGGERPIDINDKENTKRTVRGTALLNSYQQSPSKPIRDYSFDILTALDLGNNKWQIVYDLKNSVMFFRTYKSKKVKLIHFSSFDFSNETPVLFIDIHTDVSGDVSNNFAELTYGINKKYCKQFWKNLDFGFIWNIFVKPITVWMIGGRMNGYIMNNQ